MNMENEYLTCIISTQISLYFKAHIRCKVEASIVDHVHLTPHYGKCNAKMDEVCCWSIFLSPTELRLMWWWLVIDYPHMSSDDCHSQ
jgi:hypothetical protein